MSGYHVKTFLYAAAIAVGAGFGMTAEPWSWRDEAPTPGAAPVPVVTPPASTAQTRREAVPVAPPPPPRPKAPASAGQAELVSVLAHRESLMERAHHGDAASALALLSAVNRCFPLVAQAPAPLEACVLLPVELVTNRAEILESAIASDSAEAKLGYARTLMDVYRFDAFAMGRDLNDASSVGRLSEWYATQAAHQGLKDALSYLAESYLDGSFGVRDVVKAYGYLLALRDAGGAAAGADALADLRSRLAASQVLEGERIAHEASAQCCRGASANQGQ